MPPLSTTASHVYRITAFAIRRAAAVTGRQSTVQAQITHTRRLSRPTLHCTRLRDAMLCCPHSYYVRWIAVVCLAKIEIEIESKSNYLQKIESKSIETKKMTIVTALVVTSEAVVYSYHSGQIGCILHKPVICLSYSLTHWSIISNIW